MKKIRFKVSSITNAQRGQKILTSKGISSQIEKIQKPQNGEGCGYTISVKANGAEAEKILISSGIRIIGVEEL